MIPTHWATHLLKAGLILFCISLPVSIFLNDVAIALILFASVAEGNFKERSKNFGSTILIAPMAFYLLHVMGLMYTENFTEAFKQLETKAALLLLPLALGTTQILEPNFKQALYRTFVLTNAALSVICLGYAVYQYYAAGTVSYFNYHALTQIIDLHAVYFALYLALSVMLIIQSNLDGHRLLCRKADALLVMLFTLMIILLSALVIIVLLPLVILILVYKKFIKHFSFFRQIAAVSGLILSIVILVYLIPYTRNKFERMSLTNYEMGDLDYQWNSLSIRMAKWESGWQVINNHYLIGVGTGDGQDALMASYKEKGFLEGIRNNYNSHNQYIETWIMLGLPGIGLLLYMVWPFRLSFFWGVWMLLISVSFFTENMLDTQKGVVFFSFFFALWAGPLRKTMVSAKD